MRHSWWTNLTGHILLLEVSKRNVHPHISGEIDQNRIGQDEGETDFRYCIMWLNLRSIRVPANTHSFYKLFWNIKPVQIWVSNLVSVQVSCGSVELAENYNFINPVDLPLESISIICEFFSDCAWSGTLSVGSAHDWDVCVFGGQLF